MTNRHVIVVLLSTVACLSSATGSRAAIWNLSPGDDIQSYINGAGNYDILLLAPGTYTPTSQLVVNKPLTIQGNGPAKPLIQLPGGSFDAISIQSSGVILENLHLSRADSSTYFAVVGVPKGGPWPDYTVEYSDIALKNNVIEGGRYGAYVHAENLNVLNNTFKNNYRDSLILGGLEGNTIIEGNLFTGSISSKKAILVEGGVSKPYVSGTVTIAYNTVCGKGNFFVFNRWDSSADEIDLTIAHNTVYGTGSSAISFYNAYTDTVDTYSDPYVLWPHSPDKFRNITIRDNLIANSGTPVYVDYKSYGGAPDADKRLVFHDAQIGVTHTLAWNNTLAGNGTYDPLGVVGYYDLSGETPATASLNMFALSNSIVADPLFVDPANCDFRLRIGSPALNAASDGGHIGAYQGTAVPEPATLAMLVPLMGLGIGLAVRRWRG